MLGYFLQKIFLFELFWVWKIIFVEWITVNQTYCLCILYLVNGFVSKDALKHEFNSRTFLYEKLPRGLFLDFWPSVIGLMSRTGRSNITVTSIDCFTGSQSLFYRFQEVRNFWVTDCNLQCTLTKNLENTIQLLRYILYQSLL